MEGLMICRFTSCRLKEQLIKEQAEYKEALSESERNSIAIQERLKKEIHTKVDETRQEMTKLMEEQLHAVLYFRNFLPFHDPFHEWNLVHGILKIVVIDLDQVLHGHLKPQTFPLTLEGGNPIPLNAKV
jgi:hypothetical protein